LAEIEDLDLSPRESVKPVSKSKRSVRNWLIGLAIVGALSFVLFQALTSAREFFVNVDEAVARQDEFGDNVFRMQGTVISAEAEDSNGAVVFTMAFGGDEAVVHHVGDEPSSLFSQGEKVVVRGHWNGSVFQSSQVLVKHSEEYVEDNPDRLEYEVE